MAKNKLPRGYGEAALPMFLTEDRKSPEPGDFGAQPGASIPGGEEFSYVVPARVHEIMLRLKTANKDELAEMLCQKEEEARGAILNLHKRRLILGETLFVHREIFKRLGRRDWTTWVRETLRLASSTAYDYINEWKDSNGVPRCEHDESSQPSLEQLSDSNAAAAPSDTPAPERATRRTAVELDFPATITLPRLHVTSEVRDRYVELYEQDKVGMRQACMDFLMRMIGPETHAEEETVGGQPAEQAPIAGAVIIFDNGAAASSALSPAP